MEIAASQVSRIMRLALIGIATAFAWVVITLLLGTLPAHADEADHDSGVLGAVTSLVGRTASAVTGTASTVGGGVAHAVDTAVDVAPAPAQPAAREVAKTVGTVVGAATRPVSDAGSNRPVSTLTDPAVEVVTKVPFVGRIVSGIGFDDAVSRLGNTADDTLADLVGAVALPSESDAPGLPAGPSAPDGSTGVSGTSAVEGDAWAASFAAALSSLTAWFAASAVPHASSTATASAAHHLGGPPGSRAALCPPAASAGSGGAGPGAWALAALLPLVAHRAWVRRAGPEDDRVPTAPIGSTDVTPD